MYGKFINGGIEYAPSYIEINSEIIYDFNKNIELMLQYGYKEIIENKPIYDSEKEELYIMSIDEGNTRIVIYYDKFTKKVEDFTEEENTTITEIKNKLKETDGKIFEVSDNQVALTNKQNYLEINQLETKDKQVEIIDIQATISDNQIFLEETLLDTDFRLLSLELSLEYMSLQSEGGDI